MSSTWTAHGRGKVGRFDRHVSGWEIHHCGHPTALWPWSAVSPDGEAVCSESGTGWRTLAEARDHVIEALGGKRAISYQHASYCGAQRFGRLVRACYACPAPSTGRAIPGGSPRTRSVPACDRHRWRCLGSNPLAREDGPEPASSLGPVLVSAPEAAP